MTELQNLQSQFQTALLLEQPVDPRLLSAQSVAQFVVYQNAYRARLRAALRDNFGVLPQVMGDASFDALANAYIEAHPSRHYSLRWFGDQLCDFMAANETLVDHPAIVNLAQMEWALRNAFDAASATLLTPAALAAVPAADWADLRLALHPSVQLLDLQWAVGPIWHALQSGQDELAPPEALDHHMLIWRQGMTTQWKSLTPTETVLVQCLLAGQSFGKLCECLAHCAGEDKAATTAVALLSEFLNTGVIAALPTHASESSTA